MAPAAADHENGNNGIRNDFSKSNSSSKFVSIGYSHPSPPDTPRAWLLPPAISPPSNAASQPNHLGALQLGLSSNSTTSNKRLGTPRRATQAVNGDFDTQYAALVQQQPWPALTPSTKGTAASDTSGAAAAAAADRMPLQSRLYAPHGRRSGLRGASTTPTTLSLHETPFPPSPNATRMAWSPLGTTQPLSSSLSRTDLSAGALHAYQPPPVQLEPGRGRVQLPPLFARESEEQRLNASGSHRVPPTRPAKQQQQQQEEEEEQEEEDEDSQTSAPHPFSLLGDGHFSAAESSV